MKNLLRINEVAERLAISKYFVRKLIRESLIKPVRIGRAVRIRAIDVEQIVTDGNLTCVKK